MLDVKAVLGPGRQRDPNVPSGGVRIVGREARVDQRRGAHVDHRIVVSASLRVRQELGGAPRLLAHAAEEKERIDPEGPVERAGVVARLSGPAVEGLARFFPPASMKHREAPACQEVRVGRRIGELLREPQGDGVRRSFGLSDTSALAREVSELDGRRAHHLPAVSDVQGEPEEASLHAGSQHDVDDGVALRDRRQSVDADSVFGRNLFGAALLEVESAKGEEESMKEEREHRAEGSAGRLHPHGGKDAVQDLHAVVGAPREEQLPGGGAFEIDALQLGRAGSRFEVHLGRLGPATRSLERGGERRAQGSRVVGGAG